MWFQRLGQIRPHDNGKNVKYSLVTGPPVDQHCQHCGNREQCSKISARNYFFKGKKCLIDNNYIVYFFINILITKISVVDPDPGGPMTHKSEDNFSLKC
jgi:hypothetical protein